jgi:P27 family predicted phage terminase small subunit
MLIDAGVMTELDVIALGILCHDYQDYIESRALVRELGLFTQSTKKTPTKHPAVRVMETARANYIAMLKEFGLTPASRTNVERVPSDGADSDAEWDRLDREF